MSSTALENAAKRVRETFTAFQQAPYKPGKYGEESIPSEERVAAGKKYADALRALNKLMGHPGGRRTRRHRRKHRKTLRRK
jgi:hypothetical protein